MNLTAKRNTVKPGTMRYRVLQHLKRLPHGATSVTLAATLDGMTPENVRAAIKGLKALGLVQQVHNSTLIRATDAAYAEPEPQEMEEPKSPDIASPRLIFPADYATYKPGNWRKETPMRPGALDHELCQSRRANGLVPFSGMVITEWSEA